MFDIIPDIHGQADKLKVALSNLGYRERNRAWRHNDPLRKCIFLGDYIDRGPENRTVIDIVRGMIDAGTALAIMGNHELNAIHFHTRHPETGEPLRAHSEKNLRQHETFLREFPIEDAKTKEIVEWMAGLPLFLETDQFRAVHACWNEAAISKLQDIANESVLSKEQILQSADRSSELFPLAETTTKGPELSLPIGYSIFDKEGTERTDIRLKWWQSAASSWADIAMSVPNPAELPVTRLPESLLTHVYPPDAKPVFFGHYWLSGEPEVQAHNAICLDFSAGTDGPLVSYSVDGSDRAIDVSKIVIH
jgi:Calcineurin-like phosphoesterase